MNESLRMTPLGWSRKEDSLEQLQFETLIKYEFAFVNTKEKIKTLIPLGESAFRHIDYYSILRQL